MIGTDRAERHRRSPAITVVIGAVALAPAALCLANVHLRSLIRAIFGGLADTLRALPTLLAIDGPATAADAALMTVTFFIILAPPIRYFLHPPRTRLLWVPFWICSLALPAAVAPLGMALPEKWITMVFVGVLGWWGAVRPWTKWLAFVPMIIAMHPVMTAHGGPLSDRIWPKSALAPRCASNDGVRPSNFTIERASTHHYAVTPITSDLLVLTGERGAYRLRRGDDGSFAFIGDFVFAGNLWQGSLGEGMVFFTHRGSGMVAATATDLEFSEGRASTRQILDIPDAGSELDLLDAVYEPTTRSVFVTELVRGGLWEAPLTDESMHYYPLHAFYLQAVRRNGDAMLVGISTTELLVFDPRSKQVTERSPAALGAGGLDVCQTDGAAVVADYAGRLRLFTRSAEGSYRFDRGVSLSSPRRVAFSPDCEWITVSSGDDETVYVLRRADLSIWRTFRLGPALRDVVYTGAREVAVVDACTVNILPGGEL